MDILIVGFIVVVSVVIALAIREFYIQKEIKQLRMTISTLLFVISEDPEKFEQIMQDIFNVGGLGEVE